MSAEDKSQHFKFDWFGEYTVNLNSYFCVFSTFLHIQLFQFWFFNFCRFESQSRGFLINLPEQQIFHTHRHQVPTRNESTANHWGAKGHYLTNCHWGQDIGQLINSSYCGIHICQKSVDDMKQLLNTYSEILTNVIEDCTCIHITLRSLTPTVSASSRS